MTYGSPVISGGRVFIGTNNDDSSTRQKRGVLKCFSEKDGRLLWRVVHEKLPDAAEDDSAIGICSTPCVVGDSVYDSAILAQTSGWDALLVADLERTEPTMIPMTRSLGNPSWQALR